MSTSNVKVENETVVPIVVDVKSELPAESKTNETVAPTVVDEKLELPAESKTIKTENETVVPTVIDVKVELPAELKTIKTENKTVVDKKVEQPTASIPANLERNIVKQLSFYFSDTNLPYDKFLQNEIKNDDGWVKIDVLLTFKRLASLSKDSAVIAQAVKNATDSILEVSESGEKIRRKAECAVPVADQEFLNEMIARSIYCKGFPRTATMDELLEFASTFGDKIITKVTPRRLKTKEFKGTLYFTFNTKEEAEKFLKQESIKYKDVELERMWEKDFLEEKKKEYEDKLAKKDEKIKAETEKYFKKGYLLKVDNVDASVTVDSIKAICAEFEWQVAFVKIVENEKLAWIRLKPVKAAKDLLEEFAEKVNDLDIKFSLPEEGVEQTVLNEMTKEMKGVLNMKDKMKKEKNKNKGGKRYNKRRNDDGNSNNKRFKTNGN
ncbi:la protein homolog [Metopolophium dirhodum]|uniref:la protein homolog n=1 Tax=Metopolophium dirhodum TaxID=44670 RepID=UPI00298F7329|nr:la protein homolog [Metopolophium dirhodum]